MPKSKRKAAPSKGDASPAAAKIPRKEEDANANTLESVPLYLGADRYNKVKSKLFESEVDKDILNLANKIATSEPWCKNCFNLEGPSPTEDEINAAARLLQLYVDKYSDHRKQTMSMLRKTKQDGTGDMGSGDYKEMVLALVFVALGARPMLEAPPCKLLKDEKVMVLLKEAGVVAISTEGLKFAAGDKRNRDLSMIFVRKGGRAWRSVLEEMDNEEGSPLYHTQFGLLVGYTVEQIAHYVTYGFTFGEPANWDSAKAKAKEMAVVTDEMEKLQVKLMLQY